MTPLLACASALMFTASMNGGRLYALSTPAMLLWAMYEWTQAMQLLRVRAHNKAPTHLCTLFELAFNQSINVIHYIHINNNMLLQQQQLRSKQALVRMQQC